MSKKLLFLTSLVLVLALASTDVVFGITVLEHQVNKSSDDREQHVGGDLVVADDADLEEVYNTERHLLYVACTRAREHLLVTGVEPASEFLDDRPL